MRGGQDPLLFSVGRSFLLILDKGFWVRSERYCSWKASSTGFRRHLSGWRVCWLRDSACMGEG